MTFEYISYQIVPYRIIIKSFLSYIGSYPGSKSGVIAKKLGIPNPTVKRILTGLIRLKLIEKNGVGPGTNYHSI